MILVSSNLGLISVFLKLIVDIAPLFLGEKNPAVLGLVSSAKSLANESLLDLGVLATVRNASFLILCGLAPPWRAVYKRKVCSAWESLVLIFFFDVSNVVASRSSPKVIVWLKTTSLIKWVIYYCLLLFLKLSIDKLGIIHVILHWTHFWVFNYTLDYHPTWNLLMRRWFFSVNSWRCVDMKRILGATSCPRGILYPIAACVHFAYDLEKRFSLIKPGTCPS